MMWAVLGVHLGCTWDVFGRHSEGIWGVFGAHWVRIWDVFGMDLGCIRVCSDVFGMYVGWVWG